MSSSRTYILTPNQKRICDGAIVDIVAEKWVASGKWVIGERGKNGVTDFRNREYASLTAACFAHGVDVREVRKRVLPEQGGAA